MGKRTTDTPEVQSEEVQQDHPLRPYQIKAEERLDAHRRTALIAPMGSGKTRCILDNIAQIHNWHAPLLIVCGGSSVAVWLREIEKWWPWVSEEEVWVQRGGSPRGRQYYWENTQHATVIITTYGTMLRDINLMPEFHTIVADEAHKLRNRKNKTFKAFRRLKSRHLYMVTGTPVRRGPQDLFTMLNLINKKTFPSYWRYVNAWCNVYDGEFGKEILGVKNTTALREMLNQRLVVLREEDVAADLPEKNRIRLPVEMTKYQRRIYDELVEELITEIGDTLVVTPTVLAKITRLRQILVTPRIFDPDVENGAGIDTIIERLEEDPHVVIFTPFVKAIPFIEDAVAKAGYAVGYLQGGITAKQQETVVDWFRGHRRSTLVCSILYAESFDLESASVAYFLGYDWDWDTNAQAEDRLRRLTSEHPTVTSYYLQHLDSIDEEILEIINIKHMDMTTVMKDPKKLLTLLQND